MDSDPDSSGWWWLSYWAPDGFLGVAIVGPVPESPIHGRGHVPGFVGACRIAHRLSLSPGGQVKGHPVPPDRLADIPEVYRRRLLHTPDLDELGAILLGQPDTVP